ncbi:MAG: ribonuclease P protein component [Tissierellia bacterium]|nr:ribonuclease P protein component [Tissierellia bacterium]
MEKSLRLRKNSDFQAVYKRGKNYWNREFTILIKKNNLSITRIGFTVTKKYGTAVERNKIKRRLREIIRNNQHSLVEGYDIIIIPKKNTANMSFHELNRSIIHLFNTINKKTKNKGKRAK